MKSPIFSAEGRINTKAARQKDCKNLWDSVERDEEASDGLIKSSYISNNTKEELCTEYINSFLEQWSQIHKSRRLPYMIAENEYGIEKIVCTTIRPTQIPIPELYDLYECASFLAGYILYEPLDPPNMPPPYLFSPTETLNSNTGDCFDLSTLLCSFLLGNGYDAYVVNGYAPRFITLRDQSMTPCPLINNADSISSGQVCPDKSSKVTEGKSSKPNSYVPPDNSVKNSKYLQDQIEAARIAGLDSFKLWIPDRDIDEITFITDAIALDNPLPPKEIKIKKKGINLLQKPPPILFEKHLVHSWVLVCAGRRDIKESIFIEPTTGRIYSLSNSPYIGIESVWNNTNYFCNLQVEKKVSEFNWDFTKDDFWEPLFLSHVTADANTTDNGDLVDNDNDFMDQVNPESDGNQQNDSKQPIARLLDSPPSWVSPLSLNRSRYLLKFPPSGKRTIQYYCAKADMYSRKMNSQCMVMRITVYLDQSCLTVKEVHEWFENRNDKMFKRVRYSLPDSVDRRFEEFYSAGSYGEVKKRVEFPGKRIELDFYVDGRLDRLGRRVEVLGSSISEYFEGRTDYLTFRQVDLTSEKALVGSRQFSLSNSYEEFFISKMVQVLDKPIGSRSGSDIMRREFFVREGKAVFHFHFADHQITGKVRTYLHTRGPLIPILSEMALSQEVGLSDDPIGMQEAAALERDVYASLKASFLQNDKIQEYRLEVEQRVSYVKTVFEKALDGLEDGSQGLSRLEKKNLASNADAKKGDYLAAFLRGPAGSASHLMTKDEALEIRQACLDALKARLVERANIIQSRLHDENAKLARKQEQFQRLDITISIINIIIINVITIAIVILFIIAIIIVITTIKVIIGRL